MVDARIEQEQLAHGEPFRLAPGTEFMGPYPDSGFREPPMMIRRGDGHIVQLPGLLYLVAEALEETSDPQAVAARVAERANVQLDPHDVPFLIKEKLVPLGIVAPSGDEAVPTPATGNDPLLALRLRTKVIPDGAVRVVTTMFRPLFLPVIVIMAVIVLVAFDAWLFAVHGFAQSARSVLQTPVLMLLVFAIVVIAAAFHEVGHATGCRYSGAMPGAMGFGLYIVWPALYTDISASHSLPRRGRLRADLGGIYFSAIASMIVGAIAIATAFEALFVVVLVLQFEMVRQLLPLLRLDGYYVVSDLVGVPDLFGRIGPILLSFLPGREPDPRVTQLKSWVRVVVTLWVVAVVLFISYYTVFLLLALPRLIATGWASFVLQWHAGAAAISAGAWASAALAILQMFVLAAPAVGIGYMAWNLGRRWVRWWQALADHPVGRASLAAVTAVGLALLVWSWWPKPGVYVPIQPGERWVVTDVGPALSRLRNAGASFSTGRSVTGGAAPGSPRSVTPSKAPSPPSTTASPPSSPAPSPTTTDTSSPTTSMSPSPAVSEAPTPSTSTATSTSVSASP